MNGARITGCCKFKNASKSVSTTLHITQVQVDQTPQQEFSYIDPDTRISGESL